MVTEHKVGLYKDYYSLMQILRVMKWKKLMISESHYHYRIKWYSHYFFIINQQAHSAIYQVIINQSISLGILNR